MKTLRKRILATILAICCCSALNAQTSLVGRSYENPNILSGELDRIMVFTFSPRRARRKVVSLFIVRKCFYGSIIYLKTESRGCPTQE